MNTEKIENKLDNNVATLQGKISSEGIFNHEVFGEKFFSYKLEVRRQSGVVDVLPIIVSERLMSSDKLPIGTLVKVNAQFRSYNKQVDGKNKLLLNVFVREIKIEDEQSEDICDINSIELDGYICKVPIYRQTPNNREICDILLAVNRQYGKSDYIPCIAWGRNARYAQNLVLGTRIKVYGRIQSRKYIKVIDGKEEERFAYEISISKYEEIERDAE